MASRCALRPEKDAWKRSRQSCTNWNKLGYVLRQIKIALVIGVVFLVAVSAGLVATWREFSFARLLAWHSRRRGATPRLVLKIARATNGTYSATIDSPDQGSKDIQATTVNFNTPRVEVELPALRALFHGELEKGKLVGFWQQGPADFAIEFERTNPVVSASAPKGKN